MVIPSQAQLFWEGVETWWWAPTSKDRVKGKSRPQTTVLVVKTIVVSLSGRSMVRIHPGSQLKVMEDIHQQIHEEFINSEEYEKFLYELNQYGLI